MATAGKASWVLWAPLLPLLALELVAPVHAPFVTPSLYDNARLLQITCASLSAFLVIVAPGSIHAVMLRWEILPPIARLSLAVLLALIVASAVTSPHPAAAAPEIALVSILLLGGFAVSAAVAAAPRLGDMLLSGVIVAACLVFCVVFWAAFVAALVAVDGRFEWITPFVSFANVRFFSQWQAYTLPLLLIPLFDRRVARRWRAAAFLLAAHWWMLQFAVGTRAVWFAAAMTFLVMALAVGRLAEGWMKWQGAAVLAGGVLYLAFRISLLSTAPGLADVAQRGFNDSHRFALWASAVEMTRESPVLGVGPLHYAFLQTEIAAHPHNSLLQLAAEYGIPAALLVMGLMVYLLWRCASLCRVAGDDHDRGVKLCLLAGLGMGLADSLLSGNTVMPHSQVILVLLCGWLTGRAVPYRDVVPALVQRSSILVRAVVSITVVAASAVVIGAGVEYFHAMELKGFAMPFESHPRFWQQGHWPIRD